MGMEMGIGIGTDIDTFIDIEMEMRCADLDSPNERRRTKPEIESPNGGQFVCGSNVHSGQLTNNDNCCSTVRNGFNFRLASGKRQAAHTLKII